MNGPKQHWTADMVEEEAKERQRIHDENIRLEARIHTMIAVGEHMRRLKAEEKPSLLDRIPDWLACIICLTWWTGILFGAGIILKWLLT